jgi:DNA polymerase
MPRKIGEFPTAAAFMPRRISLSSLRQASRGCEGCPLCRVGTQTVFGEGPVSAQIVFVGEQPGDQEDKAGKPFVGPAGRIFDQALEEVGLDRTGVYVTNAVKHFKWEPRGKRRIHAKPNSREIDACMPWLRAELDVIHPRMVVCMGATAAQALLGRDFRVTRSRGEVLHDTNVAPSVLATVHPSSILRAPDDEREDAYRAFVDDLRHVAAEMRPLGKVG